MKDNTQKAKHILRQYRRWIQEIAALESLQTEKTGMEIQRLLLLKNRCHLLEQQIQALPPFEHKILWYRYTQGNSFEDIAEILGCAVNEVKWLHKRALRLYYTVYLFPNE